MRRGNAFRVVRAGFLATCAVGAGCTLINSYDEVEQLKPQPDASMIVGSDSGGPTTGDAAGGPDAHGGGMTDGPTEAAADRTTRGAIVLGATAELHDAGVGDGGATEESVLTALDPVTGSELPMAREVMRVSAVVYDGKQDYFYIFETQGETIFPGPNDPFFVHVRTLDTVTGAWTEVSKLQIPPGVSFSTTTVTAQRLSYIAYGDGTDAGVDGGAPAPFSLVTLDTSKPEALTVSSVFSLATYPQAALGTISPQIPQGGFVTLGTLVAPPPPAPPGSPKVPQLGPILVPTMDTPHVEPPIGIPYPTGTSPGGSAGFGVGTTNGTMEALVVTRPTSGGTGPALALVYDPSASDLASAFIGGGTFPFLDNAIKAPAFAPCQNVALVVGTNVDTSVHAVSLANIAQPPADDASVGAFPALQATAAATGHSGQGVYFEPYTNTVLTPFSQGDNFALTAFTLTMTQVGPTLTQRQAPRWVPPSDLRPNFIATKSPVPAICPTL